MARRLDNLMELAGLALLVWFASMWSLRWAVLTLAVVLFLAGNVRAVRRRRADLEEQIRAAGGPPQRKLHLVDRIVNAVIALRGSRS